MSDARLPPSWSQRLAQAAQARRALGREREIRPAAGLDFCSNDYLGLRGDPRLAEAARAAAEAYGSGAGAARLLRGGSPLHDDLEAALAAWKGAESCLLFNTGYQCNATLIPALVGEGDIVFSDALNHASLVDGCRLARARGAQVAVYGHLDLDGLETRLRAWRQMAPEGAALVATDAVFSMDGDGADLPRLLDLCERHEALLLVDEAHATGLLGADGAGLAELQGVKGRVPLLMGTLGKALGSFGAFVACPAALRDHLVNACRGFIFSTALPAPVAAASLEALRLARTEPWRRERALAHAGILREALELPAAPSAIVPVQVGPDAQAMALAARMQALGFDVRAVRPPTVPEGQARLRLTTGAHQSEAQVRALASALREALAVTRSLDRLLLAAILAALVLACLCRLLPALHAQAPWALGAVVALLALRLLRGAAQARAGAAPWPRLLLPALLLVEGAAALVRPGPLWLMVRAATAGALELLILGLAWRAWRRGEGVDGEPPEDRLARHLASFFPPPAARLAAFELVVLGSALTLLAGRSRIPSGGFTYHRESSLGAFLPVLPLLLPADLLLVEVLLKHAAPWLRWTVHALDLYGLLWVLGFWHTVRTRPHQVAGGALHLRKGLLSRACVPLASLRREVPLPEFVEEAERRAFLKGAARLGLKGAPQVLLEVDPPVAPSGLMGPARPAAWILVGVDDPAAFRAALVPQA